MAVLDLCLRTGAEEGTGGYSTPTRQAEVTGKIWGGKRESNPQPSEPQSGALPVELFPPPQVIIATCGSQMSARRECRRPWEEGRVELTTSSYEVGANNQEMIAGPI